MGTTLGDGKDAGPVPTMFVAVTVKVYGVPLVRPVTMQVRAPVVVHGTPPIPEGVTVYRVMGWPPLLAGAVQATDAVAAPGDALTLLGCPGTVAGMTVLDAIEGRLGPEAFVAVTMNVYDRPLVRPVTEQLKRTVVVHVSPPGAEVTV
jgi:hypothetical protein